MRGTGAETPSKPETENLVRRTKPRTINLATDEPKHMNGGARNTKHETTKTDTGAHLRPTERRRSSAMSHATQRRHDVMSNQTAVDCSSPDVPPSWLIISQSAIGNFKSPSNWCLSGITHAMTSNK